ncbi:hypothetical protein D046_0984B, partial [Vibrio parahaemolyticus V-223/04]
TKPLSQNTHAKTRAAVASAAWLCQQTQTWPRA